MCSVGWFLSLCLYSTTDTEHYQEKNKCYETRTLSGEMRGVLTEFSFLAFYYKPQDLKPSATLDPNVNTALTILSGLHISLRDGSS